MIDSERNGYGTELFDILNTIDEQNLVNREELLDRFWDMFVVDAFIGNWDRHNGNWGFYMIVELIVWKLHQSMIAVAVYFHKLMN